MFDKAVKSIWCCELKGVTIATPVPLSDFFNKGGNLIGGMINYFGCERYVRIKIWFLPKIPFCHTSLSFVLPGQMGNAEVFLQGFLECSSLVVRQLPYNPNGHLPWVREQFQDQLLIPLVLCWN